jgi:hypothetical protein
MTARRAKRKAFPTRLPFPARPALIDDESVTSRARLSAVAGLVVAAVAGCGGQSTDSGSAGTGGQTGGAGGAGGAAGNGAAGGAGGADASGGAGGAAGSVDCWSSEKRCGDECRSKSDPNVGCASASCDPCNLPNANAECGVDGACAIDGCLPGFADCDGAAVTGCEVEVAVDPANCGACGNVCHQICSSGTCSCACPAGLVLCGTNPCLCVDPTSNPQHCGACGKACAPGEQCSSGVCG